MTTITMEIVCRVQANPFTSPSWLFTNQQGRIRNISKEVGKVVELSRVLAINGDAKVSSASVTGVESLTDLELPRSF